MARSTKLKEDGLAADRVGGGLGSGRGAPALGRHGGRRGLHVMN